MDAFTALPDLASRTFGGGVVYASDEFFAPADHLVLPEPPTFTPRSFGPKGQVYDGWETRRRRSPGQDVAIVRLGAPGVIHGVDVDTSFFTGNYPPYASIDAAALPGYPGVADLTAAAWVELVPRFPLGGNCRNLRPVTDGRRFTHVRLTIHPDGGVARLRVHGTVVPDPTLLPAEFDVAAAEHGGRVVACSDMFYGYPHSMLLPGPARHMGDGWETARRRGPGNDWVVVRLAAPAEITLAELDTSHFKGNAPASARLRGRFDLTDPPDGPACPAIPAHPANPAGRAEGGDAASRADGGGPDEDGWFDLLPETALQPDTRHRFRVDPTRPATHVRLDVFPDGGMARLRLYGRADREYLLDALLRHGDPGRPEGPDRGSPHGSPRRSHGVPGQDRTVIG